MSAPGGLSRVEELYHAALERPPGERDSFIAQACGGDQDLLREVKSLLACEEEAKQLLEGPAAAGATQEPRPDLARRWAGRRLPGYEILSVLGAGGMGEVYRAKDTRLGREVALKVLPEAVSEDPERLSRLRQEARLLASLNHPNIAAIYGLEEAGGHLLLALELVEGETLEERLERGAIPIEDALAIATQIAEGLEAAHEKGIVHRDLKPANVKLVPDGKVKVLDFGLAKAYAGQAASGSEGAVSRSPTLAHTGTMAGVILGTAAYMSPEQASGKPVDKRADVWSFGVVLFEMLTGKRLFAGHTAAETLASVIKADPPWSALPPDCPPGLTRLLRRCLRRRRRERLHDIADARLELEDVLSGKDGPPVGPGRVTRPQWRRALPWGLATALAVACAMLAFRAVPEPSVARVDLFPPRGIQLWSLGLRTELAVSPDGRMLAFKGRGSMGEKEIYVRSFVTGEARALAGTDGGSSPFWSPDSRFIGFFADGQLKKVEVGGGGLVSLCDAPSAKGGSWSPEGIIVFCPDVNAPLNRVPDEGGEPSPITRLDPSRRLDSHRFPHFLPDGRRFLYLVRVGDKIGEEYEVRVGSLDGDEDRLLLHSVAAATYASGHLLYVREGILRARPLDLGHLELTGEEASLARGVRVDAASAFAAFSASSNGVLVYLSGEAQTHTTLQWRDRDGNNLGMLGGPASYAGVTLSPDGTRAVTTILDANGVTDLWVYDISRDLKTRFTFLPSWDVGPIWSPDSRGVLFTSWRNGYANPYRKLLEGSGEIEALLPSDVDAIGTAISPDGKLLVFEKTSPDRHTDLWVLPLEGDSEPWPFLETAFDETRGVFSPDGRWVAYVSDESGRREVYGVAFPGGEQKQLISAGGGVSPFWSGDGREVFYEGLDGSLMAVDVAVRSDSLSVGEPRRLFEIPGGPAPARTWSATPDGQRFLVVTPPESERATPLTVVFNWPKLVND